MQFYKIQHVVFENPFDDKSLTRYFFAFIYLLLTVYSINYTSQTDGNWTSPSTWTP
ncbi:MAG: hypothetical protein HS119_01880 [Flavobacteriales bacterium]|nr:hypothetical protein [Flavobacteriales bacterium]